MKSLGVTSVASFGYAQSPSSTAFATGFALAAKTLGLKVGYLNKSIPFGSVTATPIALSMKNAGVNGAWMGMDDSTNFAILTAAKDTGVVMKAAISASGYGQALLDDKAALPAAEGTYFDLTDSVPVEAKTAGTEAFQAALAKYANITGVPDFGGYTGYITADLLIEGLQAAGQNPTRASFLNALHSMTAFTAGGVLYPANLSLALFGQSPPTSCSYYVKLEGGHFVPAPAGGKPICGTLIPNSNQLP
jgi:ABC-type branched-subunit amino acid transport system substrate-binding protein